MCRPNLLHGCLVVLSGFMAITAAAQDLRLTPARGADDMLDLTLTGALPDQYHRVDHSRDFITWLPLGILGNTNATKHLTDTNILSRDFRFYRAQQVDPVTGIISLSPSSGAPRTAVVIEGQFFTSGQPGENIVLFSGAEATVADVTPTRLTAIVPPDARTGVVSVNTPKGN